MPESAAELIGQRRRWLNGSFAAGVYSLAHFPRLYKSDHGVIRLFFLHIQAIFNTITLVMSWFAIGNFYLTFDSESLPDRILNPAYISISHYYYRCFVASKSGSYQRWRSRHDRLLVWIILGGQFWKFVRLARRSQVSLPPVSFSKRMLTLTCSCLQLGLQGSL